MLRIAVQAKGRLFEETMALLEESDIKLSSSKRTLLVQSTNFPVEVLFLRVRGYHPLRPDFPFRSTLFSIATGLVRVRSPLLAESRLMSFPAGT